MKNNNKVTLLVTSIICLLPVIYAVLVLDKLPAQIPIHFDNSGNADSYLPKTIAVFGLPVLMMVINIYTHFRINNDPRVENASSTIRQATKWVVPLLSVVLIPYSIVRALGTSLPISLVATALAGIVIVICGNFLPKCRQNYTVGIKLPWTLHSETVWNKTHRFAGFLWVAGGLVILISAFFSLWNIQLIIVGLLVAIPFLYSYIVYKQEVKDQAIN
jgi:uncharacterized membrane protein